MRFKRATFRNFRLLRDVEFVFSVDSDRKLTVIRAENESGKTTCLVALQWALFGDEALPGGGKDYRLHPIDWDAATSTRVHIEVGIDFEHSYEKRIGPAEWATTTESYRLERHTVEEIGQGDNWTRQPSSTLTVFKMGPKGAKVVERPQLLLGEILPPDLREVFFTDGDRALSFIEADVQLTTKRRRVEAAVKALLGLGVLEDAQGHVKQAASDLNKKAKNLQEAGALSTVSGKLAEVREDLVEQEGALKDVESQLSTVENYLLEVESGIEAILQKGDQEQLNRDRAQLRGDESRLESAEETWARKHSDLFRGPEIALSLLDVQVAKASAGLDALKDHGSIPSNAIPVLEERLEMQLCICGTPLGEGTQERARVQELIEEQKQADDLRDRLTELYYKARSYREGIQSSQTSWPALFRAVAEERWNVERQLLDIRARIRELDVKLDALGDTDIAMFKKRRAELAEHRSRLGAQQASIGTRIQILHEREQDLDQEQQKLLKSQKRYDALRAELEAAADVETVLRRTYETILVQELSAVSEAMNGLFIEMIGADPEQGAIIQRAALTKEFDIVVFGPANRRLDPDRDLNGASRRALTLAFILALMKVSEVSAPSVVDTPLGMMSGLVKRSVLQTAIRHSTQLILFLTRSEIEGTEDIIGAKAGAVFTLTNTAHYPRMIVRPPDTNERVILMCACNHRQFCTACERFGDAESGHLTFRRGN